MATLSTNAIKVTGQPAALVAASAGGDAATSGDNVFLEVNNGGGASINVTLTPTGNDDFGRPKDPIIVAVAAAARTKIGPLVAELADPVTHLVPISYSAVTSVTVGAFRL